MSTYSYSFGDTPTAAQRLAVIARVFEPEMRSFLAKWSRLRPQLAIDLGCGPGYTTRLLAETLGADHTVGLDVSEAFIAAAGEPAMAGVSFFRHDVTSTPFPIGPAEVMFAHLLLYHLPDPTAALEIWARQLHPGGVLLVDDIESMHSDHPVLHRYLEIVNDLVRQAGGNPSIGATLARLGPSPGLELRANDFVDIGVSTSGAATMFRMNLQTWRTNPYITDRYADGEIKYLADSLDELLESDRRGEIGWRFRQMAYIRTGAADLCQSGPTDH
jgi:SAM-dependent methyltransferase